MTVHAAADLAYRIWVSLGRPWSRRRDGYGELWDIAGAQGFDFGRRRRVRTQILALEMATAAQHGEEK